MKLSEILLFITVIFFGFAWLTSSAKIDGQVCKMDSLKRENERLKSHRLTHEDTCEIVYWVITQKAKHQPKR